MTAPQPTPNSNAYDECAAAWSDYRRDHGVSARKQTRMKEHKAFCAGWLAARYGDTAEAVVAALTAPVGAE